MNVKKTEAKWIGAHRGCEDQPLGVKWRTCVKFSGIHITFEFKRVIRLCMGNQIPSIIKPKKCSI